MSTRFRVAGSLALLLALALGCPCCKEAAHPRATGKAATREATKKKAAKKATRSDPVASLAGADIAAIRLRFGPGRATPLMMKRVATLLDDQAGGAKDRVDAGLEALHLATFLLNEAADALLSAHVPTRRALERYRARMLPRMRSATKLASALRYDVEGASMANHSHHDRTAPYWRKHFDRNKRGIMRAVGIAKKRKTGGRPLVMVLGAGSCADIPLAQMVAAGCDVVLVDLDEASLKKGIAMQLSPAQRRHVRLEVRDLSQGVVDAISEEAARIIRTHVQQKSPPARARAELRALFRRQKASVPWLEGAHRVDLLVSSLLVGQLPVFPSESIARWFVRDFNEPLVRSEDDMMAQSGFGDRLFDAHMEALADLVVRSRAVVYFSSDLFLMPSFLELPAGKERYGPPRPVMGYRGEPLPDLDLPFAGNPDLRVISGSSGGQAGSDFWIWNQEPAQLAKEVGTLQLPRDGRLVKLTGKKGMVRAIDSVILVPVGG